MRLINSFPNWRGGWTQVIPGKFGGGGSYNDVLFYDQSAGIAEFHSLDDQGNFNLFRRYTDWNADLDLIIPGNFGGTAQTQQTDLLMYSRVRGGAGFFDVWGQGNINLMKSIADGQWVHDLDLIIPGNFGGTAQTQQTDLLMYSRARGGAGFFSVSGQGNITLMKNIADGQWSTDLDIIPGEFGESTLPSPTNQTDLLMYSRTRGGAGFFDVWGQGNINLMMSIADGQWSKNCLIVPGSFGGPSQTDLVFYNTVTNALSVYIQGSGSIYPVDAGNLPSGPWTHIVPCTQSDLEYTNLLFYDSASGTVSLYRSETPVNWLTGLVQAYAGATSVLPGETLTFHVSSSVGSFNLDIFRRGMNEPVLFQAQGSSTLLAVDDNAYQNGCGWPPAVHFNVPSDWSTGLYVARISVSDGATSDIKDIPFVVKASPGRQQRILCVLPFATIQAYNRWGGRGLYGHSVDNDSDGAFQWSRRPRAFNVSFDRPMLYFNCQPVLGANPALTDVEYRWVPFIKWFESNGFAVDYCTSVDLHGDPTLLNSYKLMLSIGHDEYWSKEMRDNVEGFAAAGGNVAFFSANTCWWQVRFEDGNHTMVCYKDASLDPLSSTDPARATVNWYDSPVNRPENSMTGVSWRNGASNTDNAPGAQFVVRDANHWIFAGSGLNNGDRFGSEVLLYSETDAALYVDGGGQPTPTGTDGTPLDFVIVATADLTGWFGPYGGTPRATMGVRQAPGTIFTVATNDWAQGLTIGSSQTTIDVITNTVLTRLG